MMTDLTMIKNKSLAGANLSYTSFLLANLSGVNLSDVTLKGTNFLKMDLIGVDFTTTKPDGVIFLYSDLTNSNFEGIDLSPKLMYTKTFQDEAELINSADLILKKLFPHGITVYIISERVVGNDLELTYILFHSFAWADLENANFKNADLTFADFYLANLTNADLSGAYLARTFLGEADLSNANLEDAIFYNTILTCKNHPVCQTNMIP